MPLNTSYTLNELQSFLSSTKHGELLGKIFEHPVDDVSANKPLLLIIDDGVDMLDSSPYSLGSAQPYLRDRFHPNTAVARLKAYYGDTWEPNLDHSTIRFFCVQSEDDLALKYGPLSHHTHYYIQETSKWQYSDKHATSKHATSRTDVILNDRQKKYLADHMPKITSPQRYEIPQSKIQDFLRNTNSYELLHMGWETKMLGLRDMQEQLTHFFIDCCCVMNKEIHIDFTRNAPPIIINFSKNQSQREFLLEQNHQLITRIFNIGLWGISFSSKLLISRINEKRHQYSSCTYVGLTQDKNRLSSLSATNDVIHIEPAKIQSIFLPLEKWLRTKDNKPKNPPHQRNVHSSPAQTVSHVDPNARCKTLPQEGIYIAPAYREGRPGKPDVNTQSATQSKTPLHATYVGMFSNGKQITDSNHHQVDQESPTPKWTK